MPAWAIFTALTGILVALLLIFSRSSSRMLDRTTIISERAAIQSHAESLSQNQTSEAIGSPEKSRPDSQPSTDSSARKAGNNGSSVSGSEPQLIDYENDPAVDQPAEQRTETEHTERPGVTLTPESAADSENATAHPESSGVGHEAESDTGPYLTTRALQVNVLVSQGLLLGLLVALTWWADVPATAVGLGASARTPETLVLGLGAGLALYTGNEFAGRIASRLGVNAPTQLREALAPTDARGWAVLLVVVLPLIAVFEEFLFRGVLIGAFRAGFGVSPWVLVVASSLVFGLGHGAQGRAGIFVSGLLGLVLGSVFVVSESLVLVIVAHYVVNALEFGVHEVSSDNPVVDSVVNW